MFIGRFEDKTSKAGKAYRTLTFNPTDVENLEQAKNDKGWITLLVGNGKNGIPYLSFTPRENVASVTPTAPVKKDLESGRPTLADVPF